jgi:hypothetical protein
MYRRFFRNNPDASGREGKLSRSRGPNTAFAEAGFLIIISLLRGCNFSKNRKHPEQRPDQGDHRTCEPSHFSHNRFAGAV